MSHISYEERATVYASAITKYGRGSQCIVALEELSECQKEICKVLRGQADLEHLAEEVADATIMLEQVRMMFDINDCVLQFMDDKVCRLNGRVKAAASTVQDQTVSALFKMGAQAHGDGAITPEYRRKSPPPPFLKDL